MRIAIPNWQGRVSPVFDVASKLLLVDVVSGCESDRREVSLEAETLGMRINILVELGAEVLICGAISKPLELGLIARGVQVIPQTCGQVEKVLVAYINGQLGQFLMPGCCGRRRQCRGQGRGNGRGRNMRKDF